MPSGNIGKRGRMPGHCPVFDGIRKKPRTVFVRGYHIRFIVLLYLFPGADETCHFRKFKTKLTQLLLPSESSILIAIWIDLRIPLGLSHGTATHEALSLLNGLWERKNIQGIILPCNLLKPAHIPSIVFLFIVSQAVVRKIDIGSHRKLF